MTYITTAADPEFKVQQCIPKRVKNKSIPVRKQQIEIVEDFIEDHFRDKSTGNLSVIFPDYIRQLENTFREDCSFTESGSKISCNKTPYLDAQIDRTFNFKKQGDEWVLYIYSPKIEYNFFRILLMAIIMTKPRTHLKKLFDMNPVEIYGLAKNEGTEFCQFHEWISLHIEKYITDLQSQPGQIIDMQIAETKNLNPLQTALQVESKTPKWLNPILNLF